MRRQIATLLLLSLVALVTTAQSAETPARGTLEVVAELAVNPGNLAVTSGGRVFATVHQFRRADAQLIEITGRDTYRPWPNAAWNADFGSGTDVLNSVLGIAIDRQERLWVIDNGLGEPPQRPKLIAFSLATGEPVFRYDFPPETGPVGSFLNDLAVDDGRGFVYIADIGGGHKPAVAIEKAGPKPVSDGASTDAAGNHYFTDLANNGITVLRSDGALETLVQDDRLLWPDALSFGEPGWLYIAVNQLHRAPILNGGVERAEPPFLILRVYTGAKGIAGR